MFFEKKAKGKKTGVLRKAAYATGPVMRVLLGMGAILLAAMGIKNKLAKRHRQ